MSFTDPLQPSNFYHLYNRANGKENLFYEHENYLHFLSLYQKHISSIANTYVYGLMPNHFHFLIKLKPLNEFKILLKKEEITENEIANYASQQFSNFFNAYTKAINKMYSRNGSLFARPFKRKIIDNEIYLKKIVHYIHFNPVKANLCKHPNDWIFSSYSAIVGNKKTNIAKNEVIDWFADVQNFIHVHEEEADETGIHYFKEY